MKYIYIKYNAWGMIIDLDKRLLNFTNAELQGSHEYDLPISEVIRFEHIDDYVMLFFKDKSYFQIKFENNEDLIIDHFDNDGCVINEVGCYNIYDLVV